MTSLDIIKDYNRLSLRVVGQRRLVILTPSQTKLDQAEKLASFLRDVGISHGPYLASCFASHRWSWSPKLEKLAEKRYTEHYLDNSEAAFLWWRQHEMERIAREPIELPIGREIVKARFRHDKQEALCRIQPELGGGYNNKSGYCQTCPEKEKCRAPDNDSDSRHQQR